MDFFDIHPFDRDAAFWTHVAIGEPGECWAWCRVVYRGYGYTPENKRAHRVAWESFRGLIPSGGLICHRCDVRSCCNPAHLFLGTAADNNHDRDRKGRTARGLVLLNTPKLTPQQVREIRRLHRAAPRSASGRLKRGERQAIARHFGVTTATVQAVVSGSTWKFLD